MDDLGSPISYEVLEGGTPVLSAGGEEIGTVAHVLADEATDIFDGIVIDTRLGPGGHRFADAAQVDAIHERGVVLKTGLDDLPEPSENPAALDVDPADTQGGELSGKLRRAWDLISGNY